MSTDLGSEVWVQELLALAGWAVAVVSIILLVVGFVMLIRSMKKASALRVRSHVVSIVFSVFMLIVNVLFLSSAVNPLLAGLAFVLGLGFGFLWGLTTRLTLQGKQVLGKRSILFVLFWLFSLALTYALSLLASRQAVSFGLGSVFFSAGTAIGTNLNLVLRIAWKRARG